MKCKIFLGCFVVLIGVFSYQKITKSYAKSRLREELKIVKNITIEREDGYWDVDKWISLRKAYKKVRKPKEIGQHLRLAEFELNHALLGPTFLEKVQNPPQWMLDQVEDEFTSYTQFSIQLPQINTKSLFF